jgi:aerobic carbon-monoxide dehydrogenase large subunit
MQKFGFGAEVRRKEDAAFITGRGRYLDDLAIEGVVRGLAVRAPVAHGRFTIDDVAAAKASPGVLAVYTAADIGGLGDLPCKSPFKNSDGSPLAPPPHPMLARDVVRHVGEPIAFIIAETLEQARDAAELVQVSYDDLPAVTDQVEAVKPGAPLVWADRPGNIGWDAHLGDQARVDAEFAKAAHVVRAEIVNNRVICNYMEPRSILAQHDRARDHYTVHVGCQGAHVMREMLCGLLNIPTDRMRVIVPDTGGGFGTKFFLYREYGMALLGARLLGRPVKWVSERTEHFLADYHGRDQYSVAELAFDAGCKILALRVDTLANMGSQLSCFGPFIPFSGHYMMPGCYDIPLAHARVRGVFTHTVPTDAYRGAGRPEAAYMIERLIDKAGIELGVGVEEIRRRNFVAPAAMPYKTATGRIYDSGEFAGHLDAALRASDWSGAATRKRDSNARGRLRGIGIATYIESCAGGGPETAVVRVEADGSATVLIGHQSTGQGHVTAFAQLVNEHLGIAIDRIEVIQGDTDKVATGTGSGGSRSIPVGGVSVDRASIEVAAKAKKLAAEKLETAEADIELRDGRAFVVGTDRSVTLGALAQGAQGDAALVATHAWTPPHWTYPNGTHVCELEIDQDTGVTTIARYTVVDDFGRALNPLLLFGQIHGGIAQGIGQALHERTVYDETGQLLSASFMDYTMPRASDMPDLAIDLRNVPCATNALGLKGAGEAGSIGAPPAVMNAIVDALRPLGVTHVDMPATPEKLWRLIQARRRAA